MVRVTTVEYLEINKKPILVVFGRDDFNKRTMQVVKDFKPYFYASKSNFAENIASVTAIDGEQVVKVTVPVPGDLQFQTPMYHGVYEDHVHFTTRYLIDRVEKIDPCKLRVHYTDIEKDISTNQIISIAVYDNYIDRCAVFVWRKDLSHSFYTKKYTFPSSYSFDADVYTFDNRKEMLSEYVKFVREKDPDILTGWFFTKYDMKEIFQELDKVGLNKNALSPINRAYLLGDSVNKTEDNIKLGGRVLWDMLKAYSFLQPSRLPDSSLEAISQKELGEGKQSHRSFKTIWENIDELVEYNCKDSVLVYRIDQKKHLLQYFDTLRRFIGGEWQSLFAETSLWDTYLLRKMHNKLVLPSKVHRQIDRIKGATVVVPAGKGIHRNIILLDLKSLYPSIIITFNMSPETLVTNSKNLENCFTLPNGVSFKKEPQGILPTVLLELLQLREQYKTEMKKHAFGSEEYESWYLQQEATKVLMNALYGAMLYENFRLATPEIGSSITLVGRSVIEYLVKTVENLGFKVLYGDTDSIFVYANSSNPEEIINEMTLLVENLNFGMLVFLKDFGGIDKNFVKIEAKKIYKTLMMSEKKSGKAGVTAKKRYGGIIMWSGGFVKPDSEEALEIKGFEGKRSDSSALSRDMQKKVIRMLLEGKTELDLKVYISECIHTLESGAYELEYVGIPKGLSQPLENYKTDNPHLRAALYSNKNLGTSFGQADKPKIIYTSSTGIYPKTDVVAFTRNDDLPKDFVMDVKTMIDKTIVMKLEHVFDAAGFDINNILGHKKMSFDDFI